MELSPNEYRTLLRSDLNSFIERTFVELNPETVFLSSPYLELLAAKLECCHRGSVRRLIVNLPPRSLKSHSVSVAFTAWVLGHNPASQIICASYGQDLADKHARDCRTLMLSSFYRDLFSATRLSAQKQSVNEFVTTRNGFRMSTSVGGVLTGRGADMIILDDPLKPDDAMSATKRTAVNEWYDNSLLSRLNDKERGVIIIVMQRLHQDDLVGHVLERNGWEVVSFPAIAEEDETVSFENVFGVRKFQRKEGEALHPERESLETLDAIRKTIGEYNFSSQYQQCPIPPGGAMVRDKWLQYYDPSALPEFTQTIQSWDTANKAGELNDYSVCTTWGVKGRDRFYLLEVFRRRLDFPALKRAAKDLALRWNPKAILIEDRASGTQLIQELRAEGIYRTKPYLPPTGSDKTVRLHMQTQQFESGRVLLPRSSSWLDDYRNELLAFPGSKYDDQVDSTTQALDYLSSIMRKVSIWDVL
jgi:predicted phage terminase large subunit-like protein